MKDTVLVIERYKSGFEPPGDFPFDDLSRGAESTPVTMRDGFNIPSSNPIRRSDTVKGTMKPSKLKIRAGILGTLFSSNKVCIKIK